MHQLKILHARSRDATVIKPQHVRLGDWVPFRRRADELDARILLLRRTVFASAPKERHGHGSRTARAERIDGVPHARESSSRRPVIVVIVLVIVLFIIITTVAILAFLVVAAALLFFLHEIALSRLRSRSPYASSGQ